VKNMERADAYAFSELGIQRITAKNGRETRDTDKIKAGNHNQYHIVNEVDEEGLKQSLMRIAL
jgi:hypothetical protein